MLPDDRPELRATSGDPPAIGRPTLVERAVALLEVLICSDYPTQIALASTFAALGIRPFGPGAHLRVAYIVALSLVDTAFLIALILLFLYAHRESPREVFLGGRPVLPELARGIPLVGAAFLLGVTVLLAIQHLAPSLHTVAHNPLEDLIRRGRDAVLFALVVIVAGGIREEVQRAFLLHRFERSLGGATVGLIVTSVAFGAGHLVQGRDAAIATAALGAFWGLVYLSRRSILAPMVSHAGFDLIEIVAGRMLP